VSYKVVLSPHAARDYKKLNPAVKTQIQQAVDSLTKNPVAGSKIKRLKGRLSEYYRYRAGDYRVVYAIDQAKRTVFVDYVQHRKDVYREAE
jgi:mRNA interferase RelE/StbE